MVLNHILLVMQANAVGLSNEVDSLVLTQVKSITHQSSNSVFSISYRRAQSIILN